MPLPESKSVFFPNTHWCPGKINIHSNMTKALFSDVHICTVHIWVADEGNEHNVPSNSLQLMALDRF